ncbi:MAG: anthranilate phosphoribosyltransferase [Elusimicrobiota bacterium]|jgi:anthranilate phosphoribosyltransferase
MTFAQALQKIAGRQSLSREEARQSIQELMEGKVPPGQIAGFLMALRVKGETVDELTGAAEAMRAAAIRVHCDARPIVDTCGTGGDGQCSFNLSTAAAFIAAGSGLTVAKHGNRSVSSRAGSADVLEALGLPVESNTKIAEKCLREIGLAFLFAPSFHPAMRHAMPVRRELGVRTIFNLLGPLTNPANPHVQLIGVYDPAWLKPVAEVLVQLGIREGAVVHGQSHDEMVLSGPTQVAEIRNGSVTLTEWRPEDFGIKTRPGQELKGGSADENAKILLAILQGEPGPYREAACLNAAAVIAAASRFTNGAQALSLPEAYEAATAAIDRKQALGKLDALRKHLRRAGAR